MFDPKIEDAGSAVKCQVGCSLEELEGSTEPSCSGVDDNLQFIHGILLSPRGANDHETV